MPAEGSAFSLSLSSQAPRSEAHFTDEKTEARESHCCGHMHTQNYGGATPRRPCETSSCTLGAAGPLKITTACCYHGDWLCYSITAELRASPRPKMLRFCRRDSASRWVFNSYHHSPANHPSWRILLFPGPVDPRPLRHSALRFYRALTSPCRALVHPSQLPGSQFPCICTGQHLHSCFVLRVL